MEFAAADCIDAFRSVRREVERVLDCGSEHIARAPASAELLALGSENVPELRRYGHLVGGVPPTEYVDGDHEARALYRDKLKRLAKLGGSDILVAESTRLGGFGHEIGGRLYNLDTLKTHEVLVALRRAGILNDLIGSSDRRVVYQIGCGWGGFAYQLKRLCPRVSVVLAAPPEHFLVAATYLRCSFPGMTVTIDPGPRSDAATGDFVFVPLGDRPPPSVGRIDLVVSMGDLEDQDAGRVDAWSAGVAARGCPFFYSLERRGTSDTSGRAPRPVDSWSRSYWPHEIPVMPVSYDQMLDEVVRGKSLGARIRRARQPRPEWVHRVGWRRWST